MSIAIVKDLASKLPAGSTYIWMPANIWLAACDQLGPEHTGPNTAGEIARRNTTRGISVPIAGVEVPVAKPKAGRMMGFHVENHLGPLLKAIAAYDAAAVAAAERKAETARA